MNETVCIIGGGLAGSEAALQLAKRNVNVTLIESRPVVASPVHKTDLFAELVCSNSFKSEKETSAAGMLKQELAILHSDLYTYALQERVAAGGALAVNREAFAGAVTNAIDACARISVVRAEALSLEKNGHVRLHTQESIGPFDAVILATGPLTSDALARWLTTLTGSDQLAFYDAAAPIVLAESLDMTKIFAMSRYTEGEGDYLNAPFTNEEYDAFIEQLIAAKRVIAKDFEKSDLFQACQPIEEIARRGKEAPRFGPLKPVGLVHPATNERPWAVLQMRKEDSFGQSYNLVGFQTNLTFPEQERVFRLVPGLEHAEFVRYGVMHRNTFLNAPKLMDSKQRFKDAAHALSFPLFLAGQITGTEGYAEAIRSGLQAAIEVYALLKGCNTPDLPAYSVYGALMRYATDPETKNYQPMHVNFGIVEPLEHAIRNKAQRYAEYTQRAQQPFADYVARLQDLGVLE